MIASSQTAALKAISRLLGWTYFTCWSLSFYPQPILNYQRKSTQGLAIDFPICNVLGFTAYTLSQAAFLWSATIRSQYAARHPASPEPTVRPNDLAFGAHAMLLVLVTYSQFFPRIWGFKVGARQRGSYFVLGLFWGSIAALLMLVAAVESRTDGDGGFFGLEWIDVIYALTYVKLIVTIVKYMPQVRVNWKRRSTAGFSISQVLLDFSGGILSVTQLFIDASLQADWSGVFANPVKFGLGNISIVFDVILMAQHYIIFPERGSEDVQPG